MTSLRERWRRWRSGRPAGERDDPLGRAADSLRALLDDPAIPPALRATLAAEYAEVEAQLDKLERGRIDIAVFGRVSVGKSALLNALLGHDAFEVGVLHGTTTARAMQPWREASDGAVHLVDTPGIEELDGEQRERLAHDIASRCDLLLFVVDGDMTASETDALARIAATRRPIVLVLNKADRYTEEQRQALLERLRRHSAGLVAAENVIAASARPAPQTVIQVDAEGAETETRRQPAVDIEALRERVLRILDAEGKTLAALNATLFAGQVSDAVGQRLAELRRELAAKVTRSYCLAKGIAVGLNPIPVADLLAAAGIDVALVMHLSRIYGLPLTRTEAGQLLATIAAQLLALMGAIWGVHLVASALKAGSIGLSTLLTAAAQGALAWYATVLVAKAAERYLAAGKSWGEQGPKRVVREIVDSLDRDSILREAREEILAQLRRGEARG
ncbi:MAG: GTP-binding protein [Lysobacteraceae bacterium]